ATVRARLVEASEICSDATGKKTDLVTRVLQEVPTTLDTFAEDVALIVSIEMAQLQLLGEFFDVDVQKARLCTGYSIGELAALLLGKVFEMDQILKVPLSLAEDCAALAANVTMAIVFSRGPGIDLDSLHRLCTTLSCEG